MTCARRAATPTAGPGSAADRRDRRPRWQSACQRQLLRHHAASFRRADRRRHAHARDRRRGASGLTPGASWSSPIATRCDSPARPPMSGHRRAAGARPRARRARRSTARSCWPRPAARAAPPGRSSWPARCPQPVDAVDRARRPGRRGASASRSWCPWSNDQVVAPPQLRNTVAAALAQQARLSPGASSLGGQFAHLAFPLTTDRAGAVRRPRRSGGAAVRLGRARARPPTSRSAPARSRRSGRTVLQTINALDGGRSVPGPSAYLSVRRQGRPGLGDPAVRARVDAARCSARRSTGSPGCVAAATSVLRWAMWVLCGGAAVRARAGAGVRRSGRSGLITPGAARAGRRRGRATARRRHRLVLLRS